jgi:hypothetical protein
VVSQKDGDLKDSGTHGVISHREMWAKGSPKMCVSENGVLGKAWARSDGWDPRDMGFLGSRVRGLGEGAHGQVLTLSYSSGATLP